LAAVRRDYLALDFADERLQRDRDFVLAVVAQNGLALEFVAT